MGWGGGSGIGTVVEVEGGCPNECFQGWSLSDTFCILLHESMLKRIQINKQYNRLKASVAEVHYLEKVNVKCDEMI